MTFVRNLLLFVAAVTAAPVSQVAPLTSRAVCAGNTAADRSVWCDYSIDTDYYAEVPNTGVTVEVSRFLEFTSISS
jgi:hypothetical protein